MFDLGKLIFQLGLDQKEFEDALKKSEKQFTDFGKKATALGKDLTTKLTLPIVGIGVAAIKVASDFEVSSRKFATAFQGVESQASESVKTLNESFGLAESTATRLLANTGDLLKGFGATAEQALDTSTEVQKLASALSAYNGVPVAEASENITKALLGETEGLKSLGVAIKQTDVDQRLLEKGQANLAGQALLVARAQATLELAIEQSGDAVASFAENQGTASFQISQLLEDVKDLGVQLGTILLPVVKDIIGGVSDFVKGFSELDDGAKRTIITIAGIVASIGPLISIIGGVSTAIGGLSKALTFLLANPATLAVGAVVALGAGIATAFAVANQNRIEETTDRFAQLGKELGKTEQEINDFGKAIDKAYKFTQTLQGNVLSNALFEGAELGEQIRLLENMAEEAGLTADEFARVTLENENASDAIKNVARLMIDQRVEAERIARIEAQRWEAQRVAYRQAEENFYRLMPAVQAARERQLALEREAQINAQAVADAEKKQIEARVEAEKRYRSELENTQIQLALGLISQEEVLARNLQASESYVNSLIEAGYSGADATSIGNRALQEQSGIIQDLRTDIEELADAEKRLADEKAKADEAEKERLKREEEYAKARVEVNRDNLIRLQELSMDELSITLARLDRELQAEIENATKIGASVAEIEEFYRKKKEEAEKQARDKKIAEEKKMYEQILNGANAIINNVVSAVNNLGQIRLNNLTSETQALIEQLDEQTKARLDALDRDLIGEEAYSSAVEAVKEEQAQKELEIEKKAKQEEYRIKLEAWKTQKLLDTTQAIIAGAQGAINAYKALAGIPVVGPALGIAAAAAVAGFTATQVALIQSQPAPPKPRLAEGGIINPSPTGRSVTIGEAGSSEAVIPLNDAFFNRLADAARGTSLGVASPLNGTNNNTIIIENHLDDQIISRSVVDNVNNRRYLIRQGSVV